MKNLYLKLLELLKEIPEIRYIDLNFGQLQEEKPPLAYPAVLVEMNINGTDTFHDVFQEMSADFTITLITLAQETHSLHDTERLERALEYLDLSEKIQKKLQGYEDSTFTSFDRKSVSTQTMRKGVKTTAVRYSTSWREDFATP